MTNLLDPLAWVYGAGVALRNKAFDLNLLSAVRFNIPIISVGNIVAGGVGKTPLVEYVAGYCRRRGMKTAIVSRGYKRKSTGVVVVSDGHALLHTAREGGDEPVQMASRFSDVIVIVAEKRVDAVRKAIDLGAEIIVVDDGFQHRYLARDLDIVVLEWTADLRGEHLLPAGRLREPLSGIGRADLVAFSRVADPDQSPWAGELLRGLARPVVKFRYRTGPMFRATDHTVPNEKVVRSLSFLAFSGIGNHEQFLSTLRAQGVNLVGEIRFPDHHCYSSSDLKRIGEMMENNGAQACVTTEKDFFRMSDQREEISRFFREQNASILPISVEFVEGEPYLQDRIEGVLERRA